MARAVRDLGRVPGVWIDLTRPESEDLIRYAATAIVSNFLPGVKLADMIKTLLDLANLPPTPREASVDIGNDRFPAVRIDGQCVNDTSL
jgi:hypothetical protein